MKVIHFGLNERLAACGRRTTAALVMSVLLSTPRVTPATAAELDVRISNPPATGTVYALLFKTPGTFLDLRNPDKTILIPPGNTMTGRFQNLPPGQYALVAYQDRFR